MSKPSFWTVLKEVASTWVVRLIPETTLPIAAFIWWKAKQADPIHGAPAWRWYEVALGLCFSALIGAGCVLIRIKAITYITTACGFPLVVGLAAGLISWGVPLFMDTVLPSPIIAALRKYAPSSETVRAMRELMLDMTAGLPALQTQISAMPYQELQATYSAYSAAPDKKAFWTAQAQREAKKQEWELRIQQRVEVLKEVLVPKIIKNP